MIKGEWSPFFSSRKKYNINLNCIQRKSLKMIIFGNEQGIIVQDMCATIEHRRSWRGFKGRREKYT
jgi:hypothetical protein